MSSLAAPLATPLGAAPIVVTSPVDHVAIALSRLYEQFRNKPKIAQLVTMRARRWQQIEDTLYGLLTLRSVFVATGVFLDQLGAKVGQPREGRFDDEYQRVIFARIAVNRSNGKHEELLRITRLLLNDSNATIALTREGTATLVCRIQGVALEAATAAVIASMLGVAVADGVRLLTEYSSVAPSSTFTLDAGPGLDSGHLATAIEGAGP